MNPLKPVRDPWRETAGVGDIIRYPSGDTMRVDCVYESIATDRWGHRTRVFEGPISDGSHGLLAVPIREENR